MLAKGPNFVVAPRHPLNLEYITDIESVCSKLGQQDAVETIEPILTGILRSSHLLKILT